MASHYQDQVDRVASLSEAQLDLFGDIRDIYRERVALEREFAGKLQLLAKKAAEKKTKKMGAAVFGSEPSQNWNEDTLSQSTLNNAYAKIIGSLVNASQDHVNVADALSNQVVDVLKAVERKADDNIKKQAQFYQKLLSDRDKIYNDRLKTKQKYDEECIEVEGYRQKQDRANDDKHAGRAAKQYEQQQTDMQNAKNIYLIATVVANQTKARFYTKDLAKLEDQYRECTLEDTLTLAHHRTEHLQNHLVTKFVSILHHAQALLTTHYESLKSRVVAVDAALGEVDAGKDQDLFVEYNVRPFTAIPDWVFEPCSSHYDTGEMSLEPGPKVFLQNKLSRCRGRRNELAPLLQTKSAEEEKLIAIVTAYKDNQSLGNVDEVMEDYLDASHQTTLYEISKTVLDAEIETVESHLAGDEGGQSPHAFKSSSFTIPTECGYCGTSIWGLSSCRLYRKPASRHRQSDSLSRTASVLSRSSSQGRPCSPAPRRESDQILASSLKTPVATPSSFTRSELRTSVKEEHPTARVVFAFTPTSPFELAVREGAMVHVVEEDDGSGWVKVADGSGGKGLVPASYIEAIESGTSVPQAPAPVVQARVSRTRVRGLYDYQAQGPDELDVREGTLIELTEGDSGGQNYAEGWWEGIDTSGKKGIFPSNYVSICYLSIAPGPPDSE
ncbi:hypothetical protein EVG20_g5899 [Dentipellis fragilis]|uniref:SH3 domain-containing protein n=1 Tax=Dentipellis fragilis TaxID=205917 RepID=A0A4Y9YR19_9AGAM|nr:hypothetical protein EVG20_g5899 [Dentipellis fragilis]